jgi:hypothetical protein
MLFHFQASKKKVYMLYDVEPAQSVTGGAWYSDQDFESEFVEVLNQQCFKFLEQRVYYYKSYKNFDFDQTTVIDFVWKPFCM